MSCLIVLDVCDNKVDIKDERTQSEHTMNYQKRWSGPKGHNIETRLGLHGQWNE